MSKKDKALEGVNNDLLASWNYSLKQGLALVGTMLQLSIYVGNLYLVLVVHGLHHFVASRIVKYLIYKMLMATGNTRQHVFLATIERRHQRYSKPRRNGSNRTYRWLPK